MSSGMVSESRWKRKRKLLPKLKLTYPCDLKLRKIAKLAKVDEPSAFGQHILSIMLDAHLNNTSLRNLSIPKVRKTLQSVKKKAQQLGNTLRHIDVGANGSANYVGMLLEYQIAYFRFRNKAVLIPDYVKLLTALQKAASSAARLTKAERGPKGASGNRAFNCFIESLYMAAWQRRGKWTNYASDAGPWTGSLLEALKILEPYLPEDFFPGGVLGRSIEHIKKRLMDNITKNRISSV